MSFILDALRKSEHERERSSLPGIADAPIVKPPPSKLPWILGGVGVLLALNVIVLLVVLLRPAKTGPDAGGPSAAPAAAAVSGGPAGTAGAPGTGTAGAANSGIGPSSAAGAPAAAPQGIPGAVPVPPTAARDVRPLTAEVEAATEVADSIDVPPVEEDPTLDEGAAPVVVVPPRTSRPPVVRPADAGPAPRSAAGAMAAGAAPPAPRVPAPGAGSARTSGVPSIDDLAPQATAGLPQLTINLHVHSPDPAQSFVVLNGRRYLNGAQLQEGPTLERITADGAILNHRGLRFLLPRP